MSTALFAAGLDFAGGLFGGGGPDPRKVANRTATVDGLTALAASGNVNAWHLLGAVGRVAPLPYSVTVGGIPPGYNGKPAGWRAERWGDVYGGLQSRAASEYRRLAARFLQSGVVGAAEAAASLDQAEPVSVLPSQPVKAPQAFPAWVVWVFLGLAVLFIAFRM